MHFLWIIIFGCIIHIILIFGVGTIVISFLPNHIVGTTTGDFGIHNTHGGGIHPGWVIMTILIFGDVIGDIEILTLAKEILEECPLLLLKEFQHPDQVD